MILPFIQSIVKDAHLSISMLFKGDTPVPSPRLLYALCRLSVRAGFQIEAVTFEMLKHSFYAIAVAIVLNSQRGYYTTNQV